MENIDIIAARCKNFIEACVPHAEAIFITLAVAGTIGYLAYVWLKK